MKKLIYQYNQKISQRIPNLRYNKKKPLHEVEIHTDTTYTQKVSFSDLDEDKEDKNFAAYVQEIQDIPIPA